MGSRCERIRHAKQRREGQGRKTIAGTPPRDCEESRRRAMEGETKMSLGILLFLLAIGLLVYLNWQFWKAHKSQHQHNWHVDSTHYTEPFELQCVTGPAIRIDAMSRRATEGVTHLYLRCSSCGDVQSREVYGRWTQAEQVDAEQKALRKVAGLD
jgi:hypothetical protein